MVLSSRKCIVAPCKFIIVWLLPFFYDCKGTNKICLIILNQPLEKNYLHILWSKGEVYLTQPYQRCPHSDSHILHVPLLALFLFSFY